MEKQVEFFVSPLGVVCYYGHDGKVLSYNTEHPDIINHMAELISRLYPEAYKYLADLYAKSKPNKLYFKYLITDRFIRCNLGSNDTLFSMLMEPFCTWRKSIALSGAYVLERT